MPVSLVTGATGFVGGALARHLMKRGDHKVVAICRDGDPPDGCVTVRGELEDLSVCERAIVNYRPDCVYHLAAQAIVGNAKMDPWATFESNVRGTYNLMEACRRHSAKRGQLVPIVVASSDKAYGDLPEGESYKETDPLNGAGFYDCSKACTDMIAQCYGRNSFLPVAVIRAGNIYGPGDTDRSRIVPSLIADAIEAWSNANGGPLNVLGMGTEVRDYLFIDDAVAAYVAASKYVVHFVGMPQCFNVAGGEAVSTEQLAELLSELCREAGFRTHVKVHGLAERVGEIPYQSLDCSRAASRMSFRPRMSLRAGLRLTLDAAIEQWNRDNR